MFVFMPLGIFPGKRKNKNSTESALRKYICSGVCKEYNSPAQTLSFPLQAPHQAYYYSTLQLMT